MCFFDQKWTILKKHVLILGNSFPDFASSGVGNKEVKNNKSWDFEMQKQCLGYYTSRQKENDLNFQGHTICNSLGQIIELRL
jgi:hypothetical protein